MNKVNVLIICILTHWFNNNPIEIPHNSFNLTKLFYNPFRKKIQDIYRKKRVIK